MLFAEFAPATGLSHLSNAAALGSRLIIWRNPIRTYPLTVTRPVSEAHPGLSHIQLTIIY